MNNERKEFYVELAKRAIEDYNYAEEGLKSVAFQVEYGRQPTTEDLKQSFPYRKILREKLGVVI